MTTEDIINKYKCKKCGGHGWIDVNCSDPQCGDSTWDHYCTSDYIKCADCKGRKLEQILAEALFNALEELEVLKETLRDFVFIRRTG